MDRLAGVFWDTVVHRLRDKEQLTINMSILTFPQIILITNIEEYIPKKEDGGNTWAAHNYFRALEQKRHGQMCLCVCGFTCASMCVSTCVCMTSEE